MTSEDDKEELSANRMVRSYTFRDSSSRSPGDMPSRIRRRDELLVWVTQVGEEFVATIGKGVTVEKAALNCMDNFAALAMLYGGRIQKFRHQHGLRKFGPRP